MRDLAPLSLTLLALAGCSMAPELTLPVAPVASEYSPAGQTSTASATSACDLKWQDYFKDPALQQLIKTSLVHNRDLQTAMAHVKEAQLLYDVQAIKQLPVINGNAAYTVARNSVELTPVGTPVFGREYTLGIGLTAYEIDFFGRLQSLKEEALAQYLSTEEAALTAQLSLIAEVSNAYLNERESNEQLSLAREILKARETLYTLSQQRLAQGSGSLAEVTLNESLFHAAQIAVADWSRQQGQAMNALTLLVGTQVPGSILQASAADDMMVDLASGLPSALLQNRPDIRQAEHNLRAANAHIGAARAAFFPTVSLTTGIGTGSGQLSHLFQANTRTWNFSPALTLPIFDWGNNIKNLDLSEVRKELSIIAYEKAIQNAFKEVMDALVARDSYNHQYNAQQHYTASIAQQTQLIQNKYDQGIASEVDLYTSRQNLFEAQQNLIQIKYARLKNKIALYKVLGGGEKTLLPQ